jgi:hypothetical protein
MSLANVIGSSQPAGSTNPIHVMSVDANGNPVGAGSVGSATVSGITLADAPLTLPPVTEGGLARTTPPVAVQNADVVNALFNIYGEQIVRHSLREMKGFQRTTLASSIAETQVVTPDATYKLDLYGLALSNTSATYTKVTVRDGVAGIVLGVFSIPPQDTRGFMLPACDGVPQSAINRAWTVQCGTSVADLEVTAFFTKNL